MTKTNVFADLAIGRTVPGSSLLHQAPPLGKAALLCLLAVGTFGLTSTLSVAIVGLSLSLLAALARIPQTMFWRSLRPLLPIAFFTILSGLFFQGPPAGSHLFKASWEGLHLGALYSARLLLITLISSLFFLTTPADHAVALGITLLTPLRLIGIEPKELSLLVHLAYRFIPLLTHEIEAMNQGRRARGLSPPQGLIHRIKDVRDRVTSLVICAIHRAEITAMALEDRMIVENWKAPPLFHGRWIGLLPLGIALGFELLAHVYDGAWL